MTKEQAIKAVITAMQSNTSIVQATYYVLWFMDKEENVYAYDSRDPVRGVAALLDKHPELTFKHIDPMPSSIAAMELCKWMRIAREAKAKLKALSTS